MKKRYLSVAVVAALAGSLMFSSCIGSFALTKKMMNWNNKIGNKFVNELVFIAFWILPVYEVTSIADLLVLNSIEFWSGNEPLAASVKVIDTRDGRYRVECDGRGYTVTCEATSESFRLDFDMDTATWSLSRDGEAYPFMTMIDDTHVKMITPDGDMRLVELNETGVAQYSSMAGVLPMASR